MYDYLIVGAGLYGAVIANRAVSMGKKVLVIERRDHIGGNVYTEEIEGINVHKYGAHIFHTDYEEVWKYVNQFVEFNRFTNSPIARIGNELYNMPFNMNTFSKIWPDVLTPDDAMKRIESERAEVKDKEINDLETQAISLVGRTIYEKLVKGYTEKQWEENARICQLLSFVVFQYVIRLIIIIFLIVIKVFQWVDIPKWLNVCSKEQKLDSIRIFSMIANIIRVSQKKSSIRVC